MPKSDDGMAEAYLVYSSLVLGIMASVALVLSFIFRRKSDSIEKISDGLSASVFDRSFVIYNPYPDQRRIIHSLLSLLPIFAFAATFGIVFLVVKIFEYGFVSSLVVLLISMNLVVVEAAPEVLQNALVFAKAIRKKNGFGVGDLMVLDNLRSTLPRLSNYYLGLAILFAIFALALNYVWTSVIWLLARFIGFTLEIGTAAGHAGWAVSVALFIAAVICVQILFWKIKSRLLG